MGPGLETPVSPVPHRRKGILWLAAMILAFLGVLAGLQAVAAFLRLQPLAAVALGQVGILAVPILFALADGRGFRGLGLLGPWKAYDPAVIVGIIGIHLVGSIISGLLILSSGQPDLSDRSATVLLKTFGSYDTATFMLIAAGLALQSGIAEELLFRGYLITRLEGLGLRAWPTVLTSALIFGLVHWPGYGFLASMSKAVWFGIPTGVFFWHRRSLGPLMAAHSLMNFLGFATAHLALKLLPNLPVP